MATTNRDLVLPLNGYDDLDEAVALAQFAERLGYGHVSMGETTGRSVPLVLGLIAERTDDVGIADDVLSPFSRTPTALGQIAVTLQEISDGRFRLRIGASSPALAEKWHGVGFDRPLRRVRETIEIVRQVQSGERLDYDGECFSPDTLKLTCPPPETPAPIDVAALGPKATELAGRFADGWVPQLLPIDGLRDRMDDLRRGADLGGRSIDDVRVALLLRCCAIEDGERAREYARRHVAFMIARYGPYYRKAIADAGWQSLVDDVGSRWREGDRDGASAAVSDDLLHDLVVAGTPTMARERLEGFEAVKGVDAVQIGFFGGMSENERRTTVTELAPGRD
ncbi:TIGR04024 family LLM class F420-dependent oxidoreductase [Halalkalicoccus sp. NIPERK01]|uniref:TIGR04024 family LLM class F420-dependent oxidoreductase n=1 Tax=Halalkalicoccus sp. NIPERK01 TaxID=3053469 RepID=UPI0034E971D9